MSWQRYTKQVHSLTEQETKTLELLVLGGNQRKSSPGHHHTAKSSIAVDATPNPAKRLGGSATGSVKVR